MFLGMKKIKQKKDSEEICKKEKSKDKNKPINGGLKYMSKEEQEKVKNYITELTENLASKHNFKFNQEQIDNVISQFTTQDLTFEDIKTIIDDKVNQYISRVLAEKKEVNRLKGELQPTSKHNSYFGEVYKTYVIHILNMYKEISNSNLSEEEKRTEFETRMTEYLGENEEEMMTYLQQQTTDERLISIAPTELYRGADSLTFDTVKNLYDTFANDITIVSNDSEGKMYTTVLNNQKIFDEPIIDEEGNIRINPNIEYNFDMIKETYDFAKENGKQVKFHTFLWHNAIPENLRNEIDGVSDPILKRKMALEFLQNYASNLLNFMQENGYDLRQLEALNEIASDEPGENTLRDSWWKDVIGNNPENGDAYFIDVLKIVKRNFPDTEIIYNEYNEFISDKTDRIVDIIEQVKKVEERDGITILDGIGLQAHYSDYIKGPNRPLTQKDILESAVKLQKACGEKGIYITEYDFIDFEKNGNKEQLEQAFIDSYGQISNGFIMWGNSDSLTWYHCIDENGNSRNAQIIDADGKPKEIYEQYREAFYLGRRQEQDYTITPNQIAKKSISAHIGKKDIAKGVVDRKVEERTNPQELYPHNHNGSQGGTNDGR